MTLIDFAQSSAPSPAPDSIPFSGNLEVFRAGTANDPASSKPSQALFEVPNQVQVTSPSTVEAIARSSCSAPSSAPAHLSIVDATWNNLSWRQHASCANLDTNVFFPVGLTGSAIEQTNLAKSICSDCPVANQCLEFALRTLQDYGVWGGRSEDERRAIRRSRRAAARRAAAASAAAVSKAQKTQDLQVAGA